MLYFTTSIFWYVPELFREFGIWGFYLYESACSNHHSCACPKQWMLWIMIFLTSDQIFPSAHLQLLSLGNLEGVILGWTLANIFPTQILSFSSMTLSILSIYIDSFKPSTMFHWYIPVTSCKIWRFFTEVRCEDVCKKTKLALRGAFINYPTSALRTHLSATREIYK